MQKREDNSKLDSTGFWETGSSKKNELRKTHYTFKYLSLSLYFSVILSTTIIIIIIIIEKL